MTLKDIISAVKISCEENKIKPSDDMILDCSTRIFNSQNIKIGEKKIVSVETPQREKESVKATNTKPTDKQKFALINNYGYTEKEVDNRSMQDAYDTIKKEKEIERKEKLK